MAGKSVTTTEDVRPMRKIFRPTRTTAGHRRRISCEIVAKVGRNRERGQGEIRGFPGPDRFSIEAGAFDVTREGIRQIEAKALRQLRSPERACHLRALLAAR